MAIMAGGSKIFLVFRKACWAVGIERLFFRNIKMINWKEFSLLHVFLFLSFMVSGLMVNMVQLVLYLVIVKVLDNRSVFRSLNYYLIYSIDDSSS